MNSSPSTEKKPITDTHSRCCGPSENVENESATTTTTTTKTRRVHRGFWNLMIFYHLLRED